MNIDALKKMLTQGQDNLLLRFGLGKALLDAEQPAEAIEHLLKAIEFSPDHSASWKLLGKAYANNGQPEEAIKTYNLGIKMADMKGDIQAAKEMKVFLKRAEKEIAKKE